MKKRCEIPGGRSRKGAPTLSVRFLLRVTFVLEARYSHSPGFFFFTPPVAPSCRFSVFLREQGTFSFQDSNAHTGPPESAPWATAESGSVASSASKKRNASSTRSVRCFFLFLAAKAYLRPAADLGSPFLNCVLINLSAPRFRYK